MKTDEILEIIDTLMSYDESIDEINENILEEIKLLEPDELTILAEKSLEEFRPFILCDILDHIEKSYNKEFQKNLNKFLKKKLSIMIETKKVKDINELRKIEGILEEFNNRITSKKKKTNNEYYYTH